MSESKHQYILSIDQGTSSSRCILFDRKGQQVKSHQVEFDSIYPKHGENWVEHDPETIYQTVKECMERATEGIKQESIAGLGITNQRETSVLWDKSTGKPLHHAIVWLDTRTQQLCEKLIDEFGSSDHFRETCGLPISTYFSAMKIRWMMENVPAVKQAIEEDRCLFGTIDSWLIYNLTGGSNGGIHVTDVTNASRTMLMDLASRQWSEKTCKSLGIPMSILPRIASNSEKYGVVASGPCKGLAITGCVGDQQAAVIGQYCYKKGSVKNTYGTGCFMLMNTGPEPVISKNGLLTTVAYQMGPDTPVVYALEGAVAVAGLAIKWLRDNLKMIDSAKQCSELAATVDDTGGLYFVPAFSGLFAPHWRMDAKGLICGMTLEHNRAHVARAALEAVCFRSHELIRAMETDSGISIKDIRVDGGMSISAPLVQFQADLLNRTVARPENLETTAFGAAIAAGLATGFWSSLDAVMSETATNMHHVSPNMSEQRREELVKGWDDAVRKSFGSKL